MNTILVNQIATGINAPAIRFGSSDCDCRLSARNILHKTTMTTKMSLLIAAMVFSGLSAFAVNLPPVIVVPPVSQVVASGTTVNLSVTATGNALQYQWFLNGYLLNGATGATLTITNLTASSSGAYQAVVFQRRGHCKKRHCHSGRRCSGIIFCG